MSKPQYTPEAFRNLIKMKQHKKILLVEGREDKLIFEKLLFVIYPDFQKLIEIYSAEHLIKSKDQDSIMCDDSISGNCQKVEEISISITDKSYKNNFVGFSDRQFREFDIRETIDDKLKSHKVNDRLVWSRGHSIENYLFDLSIIRNSLLTVANDHQINVVDLFEKIMPSTINLACTLSIVAYKLKITKKITTSITFKDIEIDNNKATLKIKELAKNLIQNNPELSVDEDTIIKYYKDYYTIVEKSEFDSIRWLCHGHIGMKIIWTVYSCCVFTISGDEKQAQKSQRIKEDDRTQTLAQFWVLQAANNSCYVYPKEVLQLLNFQ